MTLYKSSRHDSSITISSSVYSCTSCEHTELVKGEKDDDKKCPVCDAPMIIMGASEPTEEEDSKDQE